IVQYGGAESKYIKENYDWIKVENPWASQGLGFKSFFLLEILMFIGLALGWNEIFIEGSTLSSNWLPLLIFCLLPGLIGVLVMLLVLRNTITYISADDKQIALKFATGRIKKFNWRRLLDVRVGGRRGTYVALNGLGKNYAFNLNSVRGIIYYYEKAAQKRVRRV
ncbi:MAG: hypothetical protein JSW28_07000, partial [Thermoplasmata archaeon]